MWTRVELFEHETVRVGQPLRCIGGGTTPFTESAFDALARYSDATGNQLFKLGHRRITTTQHVGYVEVGRLSIEILPKADRTASAIDGAKCYRDGLLDMLRIATGLRLRDDGTASQRVGTSTLLELVVTRFLDELERLLHEGLARGYREHETNGATFRGRLVFHEHLRENLARADRFYVRAVTYDRDTLVNRILAAALAILGDLGLTARTLARVNVLRTMFPEVSAQAIGPQHFDRLALGRTTARYAGALAMARLLLERSAPQLRWGKAAVFALLFDMNLLWESYVAALFRRAAAGGLGVAVQETRGFWKATALSRRTVRADLIVRARSTGRVLLVADTKWKVVRDGVPDDDHLKQMFVYNELFGCDRAMLIYPSAGLKSRLSGTYLGNGRTCDTLHLGVIEGGKWSRESAQAQVGDLLGELAEHDGAAAHAGSPARSKDEPAGACVP